MHIFQFLRYFRLYLCRTWRPALPAWLPRLLPAGIYSLSIFIGYYLFSAALAFSASTANAAGSEIASSDSILRLMSMPATFRPLISLE